MISECKYFALILMLINFGIICLDITYFALLFKIKYKEETNNGLLLKCLSVVNAIVSMISLD